MLTDGSRIDSAFAISFSKAAFFSSSSAIASCNSSTLFRFYSDAEGLECAMMNDGSEAHTVCAAADGYDQK